MDHELTEHARESLRKRDICTAWLERALSQPEREESDDCDPELEHRLRRIEEYEGRVLRVIVNKTCQPVRVVTAYFDRAMRNRL